jgi:hypothetical protein
VSNSSSDGKSTPATADGSREGDAFHNPSYLKRTHYHEKDKLEETVRTADAQLGSMRATLDALASDPRHAEAVRLYHQLTGARDQIAECARRLPLEAGELYDEDKERYEQAVAAFERLRLKWAGSVAGAC